MVTREVGCALSLTATSALDICHEFVFHGKIVPRATYFLVCALSRIIEVSSARPTSTTGAISHRKSASVLDNETLKMLPPRYRELC